MRNVYRFWGVSALLLVLGISQATAQPQELPLGSSLPMQDHPVQHVDGTQTTIGALTGTAGTVFLFWSNQCLWVDKYEERVQALHDQFAGQGIHFVLVNANDPNAFPKEAAAAGLAKNYPMAYVVDAGSQFAREVGAFRTPHAFAFDAHKMLVYTGAIDDSPSDPTDVEKTYLEGLVGILAQGGVIGDDYPPSTKAYGCRIKFQMP